MTCIIYRNLYHYARHGVQLAVEAVGEKPLALALGTHSVFGKLSAFGRSLVEIVFQVFKTTILMDGVVLW